MTIPRYDEIMPVALAYLEDCGLIKYRDMEAPLAKLFTLSEEDVAQEYESKNGTFKSARQHSLKRVVG